MPDSPTDRMLRVAPPVGLTACYLRRDGFVLELLHFGGTGAAALPPRERAMNEPGLTHLSVSVDDVAATCARVAEFGGQVLDDTDIGGGVFVRDPDGQLVELLHMGTGPASRPEPDGARARGSGGGRHRGQPRDRAPDRHRPRRRGLSRRVVRSRSLRARVDGRCRRSASTVRALVVAVDLVERHAAAHIAQRAVDEFGRIDILVNNAGGNVPRKLLALTADDWQAGFEQNFFSAVRLTQACLPDHAGGGLGSHHQRRVDVRARARSRTSARTPRPRRR